MADSEKVVVMHSLVNNFSQGDVISVDELKTYDANDKTKVVHDARQRLLDMGAIRPATAAEAGLARVPATQAGLSSAQTGALAALDATVQKLTSDLAAVEERARAHAALRGAAAPVPAPEDDPAFQVAIKERQVQIEHLNARIEAASKTAEEHRAALAEASKQAQAAVPAASSAGEHTAVAHGGTSQHTTRRPRGE